MSASAGRLPEQLQTDSVEAQLLRREVWKRLWKDNEHFMGVIVGREGKGKSHTGIKIAECVDPTFDAERVLFDPVDFLERLQEWRDAGETQGKLVVIDEAGVGVGVRTWYEEDQVALNQTLQIIRDENMGVLFTLPRLEELDSQTRGRLHAFIEVVAKKTDDWVKLKWLEWDPTRDGRNKIYREYPEMTVNGHRRTIKRLKISPPSSDIVANYEERKDAFQETTYAEAIDTMTEDVDDQMSVKEVAMEIADGALGDYVSVHSQNGTPYINQSLIGSDYDLSQNDASAVKSLLGRQFDREQLESHV